MDDHQFDRALDHVFLPPKLPQKDDPHSDITVVQVAIAAVRTFLTLSPGSAAGKNALTALENLAAVNSLPDGAASELALSNRLTSLSDGEVLPIHVRFQNAAVMITRRHQELIFEAFELSPRNEAVTVTEGRLIRTFPGLAIVVDLNKVPVEDLIPTVAKMIATLSQQSVPGMQPLSRKAGSSHDEYRDSTDPAGVTELFFGFLRCFGEAITVSSISKCTREDGLWKSAESPWRRSPAWLLIRVVLQLISERSPNGSRFAYKELMVSVIAHALKNALRGNHETDRLFAMQTKILQRLHKLQQMARLQGRNLTVAVLADVNSTLKWSSEILTRRWCDVQQQNIRELDLEALAMLEFENDTYVDLSALDQHITRLRSHRGADSPLSFVPSLGLIK